MRKLEAKGCEDADNDSDGQAPKEHEQEYTNSLEEAEDAQRTHVFPRFAARNILLCRLKQDNGDGIIQYGLAKYDRI